MGKTKEEEQNLKKIKENDDDSPFASSSFTFSFILNKLVFFILSLFLFSLMLFGLHVFLLVSNLFVPVKKQIPRTVYFYLYLNIICSVSKQFLFKF